MAKKKGGGHGGGHGWFVTFADLMGLLMSFFVMLTAYSTMDQKKLQMVAGSMAQAFGVMKESRFAGIVELDGTPTRPNVRNLQHVDPTQATDHPAPRQHDVRVDGTVDAMVQQRLASAAASIRQALQANPELADISSNVLLEQTRQGLAIQLVDQDGRSMFPDGSSMPNERTRSVMASIAPVLARLPNPIEITGHTAWAGVTGLQTDGGARAHWQLSAERALAIQDALAAGGVSDDRFAAVTGKGDTDPAIADDPSLSVNRRVSIVLLTAAGVMPDIPGP
jgi:chemotaxis protein MotB